MPNRRLGRRLKQTVNSSSSSQIPVFPKLYPDTYTHVHKGLNAADRQTSLSLKHSLESEPSAVRRGLFMSDQIKSTREAYCVQEGAILPPQPRFSPDQELFINGGDTE